MDRFLELLAQRDRRSNSVAFSGAVSRTWRSDTVLLADVMQIMMSSIPFHWVTAGRIPFDDHVETAAAWCGIDGYCLYEDVPRRERLACRFEAPRDFLGVSDALVVFSGKQELKDPQLDPIVRHALTSDLLVCGVNREGEAKIWNE